MIKFKIATASILATAAITLTVPASAEVLPFKVSKEVSYKGLDLSSAEGQKKLQKRIDYAVRVVCGNYNRRSIAELADARQCMANAHIKAKRDAEIAIALHSDRNRQLAARDRAVVGN